MKKLLFAVFGAALFGLAYGVSPTSAAPAGPAQIAAPDSGVDQARMTRKQRMMRQRMTKRRAMRRGMTRGSMMRRGTARATQRSTGGNAEQPARNVPLTGRGGTGGAGGGGAQ
jgi:hypothetical protein